ADPERAQTAHAKQRPVHRTHGPPRDHDSPYCRGTKGLAVVEEASPVPWHLADLALFAAFFLGAAVLVPIPIFLFFRFLNPGSQGAGLPGPWALVAQLLINVAVVGFVFFLVRLHGRSIREA